MDTIDSMPVAELDIAPAAAPPRRHQLLQGITWSAVFQMLEVGLSFGSMLILVRIIAARDYGRAAAVTGILSFVGIFNAHLFYEHALQLPDGQEPDWDNHWTWGFYIQSVLAIACHGVAGLCWLSPSYRPIAPLVHIAAFGVLLEWPNQFAGTTLRRALDIRRIKIVAAAGMMLRLTTTLVLALAGKGAYAIVIGNNLVPALPFAVDLLMIRGWRPKPGWWRPPVWRAYATERGFGVQRALSNVVGGVRSALEAAVLPAPLGFAALGLLNRSQALYGTSIGRVGAILNDAVYPFLPRVAANRERFASHATTYLQVIALISIPGALFVGQQGPLLSRVLYGAKWIAMDPLIWPGAVVGLAFALIACGSSVVMAAGAIRACLILDAVASALGALALVAAYTTQEPVVYLWALAAAEIIAAAASVWFASRFLERHWFERAILPAVAVALAGLAVASVTRAAGIPGRPAVQLALLSLVYGLTCLVVLRLFFSSALDHLLRVVPAGERLRLLVRMPIEDAR